jgi:hypothetical protein
MRSVTGLRNSHVPPPASACRSPQALRNGRTPSWRAGQPTSRTRTRCQGTQRLPGQLPQRPSNSGLRSLADRTGRSIPKHAHTAHDDGDHRQSIALLPVDPQDSRQEPSRFMPPASSLPPTRYSNRSGHRDTVRHASARHQRQWPHFPRVRTTQDPPKGTPTSSPPGGSNVSLRTVRRMMAQIMQRLDAQAASKPASEYRPKAGSPTPSHNERPLAGIHPQVGRHYGAANRSRGLTTAAPATTAPNDHRSDDTATCIVGGSCRRIHSSSPGTAASIVANTSTKPW